MTASRTSNQGLARSAIAGTGWLLAQNVGSRLVGFGSQIVLARILLPGDFGNLGLALTITTLAGALANFGVDDVLLQRQRTLRFWAMPAFATSLGLGLLSFLAVLGAAPLAAMLYHAPVMLSLLPMMALAMPLTALSTVPTAQIRAKLDFRFLAGYTTAEMALQQVLTIALALSGFGVYSFAIPAPVMAGLRAAIFWMAARPRLHRLRLKQLRMMGANSAAVFGTKILTAAIGQGDYFVLGLLAAKPVVGAYFFAFRLAIQPVQLLAGNLSNVLFPVLSQLRGEPARQRLAALEASRILAFVVMPYCFLQAAVAKPLLSLVFGPKWEAAIPLVEILSIGLAFDAVSWVAGALLQARGEFRRSLLYSCVFSPFFFLVVTIGGIAYSALGVAVAVSAFYIVLAPVYSYKVFHQAGISLREIASIYVPPALLAAMATAAANWLCSFGTMGDLGKAATIGIAGSVFYLGLMCLFARPIVEQLARRLRTWHAPAVTSAVVMGTQ